MRLKIKENKGITLIALVITIIVLLILAGVTIAMLTGHNGLLNKTSESKIASEIGEEKEQMSLAMTNMKLENEENEEKREQIFQGHMDEYAGEGKTKVYNAGDGYTVHFLRSNRVYTINSNGNINEENIKILEKDQVAGAFDGTGTKNNPFVIMSIEDLVYLANQVNSKTDTYIHKYIKLGKTLDFKSKLSYKDDKTTYRYDENTNSYIVDKNSTTTLKELLTTGNGFIPIGVADSAFCGSFDGNNYAINNIYENRSGYAGLFGYFGWYANICNLEISGNIISTDSVASGIAGCHVFGNWAMISGCVNKANVQGETSAGGIVGTNVRNMNFNIIDCKNYGSVSSGMSSETNSAGRYYGVKSWKPHHNRKLLCEFKCYRLYCRWNCRKRQK